MSNFSNIKKQLSASTTLPAGNDGGAPQWMMGSAHSQPHHHEHNADGSCCGHNHDEHECDEEDDNTNPTGGCC